MQKHKGHWLTQREAAQARLSIWGEVYRRFIAKMAPPDNMYSSQPFIHERLDTEALKYYIEQDERLEYAIEVDEWLQDIRAEHDHFYIAAFIRYVHGGRTIDQEKTWYACTGLGRSRYGDRLRDAERKIGMMMAVASAF